MVEFLEAAQTRSPFLHIPDRILEGYGPNVEAIRELSARGASPPRSRSIAAPRATPNSTRRGRLGMDTIVIDHHQAPEILPDAIIVNPNRQDDSSPGRDVCAPPA